MVIVNTVVIVRAGFEAWKAILRRFFATYAVEFHDASFFALLKLLEGRSPRSVMITGSVALPVLLAIAAFTELVVHSWFSGSCWAPPVPVS